MQLPFTGSCACGAVRYSCSAKPVAMFKCHCRDCQHATGGGAACVVYAPLSAFAVTQGALRYHYTPGLDGIPNKRGFCETCGSPMTGGETETEIGIHAASLDDPSWFRPKMHVHVTDAQPWDYLDPDLPRFDLYPNT